MNEKLEVNGEEIKDAILKNSVREEEVGFVFEEDKKEQEYRFDIIDLFHDNILPPITNESEREEMISVLSEILKGKDNDRPIWLLCSWDGYDDTKRSIHQAYLGDDGCLYDSETGEEIGDSSTDSEPSFVFSLVNNFIDLRKSENGIYNIGYSDVLYVIKEIQQGPTLSKNSLAGVGLFLCINTNLDCHR